MTQADWLEAGEALTRVVAAVVPLSAETVPLGAVRGRVLAADLIASIDVPPWTNSAMDGFALRAADIAAVSQGDPAELPIVDDIAAGGFPRAPLKSGQAARIMTGAPVPEGADSVVRLEHTDGGHDLGRPGARVRILDGQDAGRNLRRRGEDLQKGSVALSAGAVLTPAAIGVAASLGFAEVPVTRRPLVAVLTSGDELVEVDQFEEVRAGRKIVSSNSYTLAAQLAETGCEMRYLGIARDDPDSLRSALERAEGCDALITSAGISVGEHDHVKRILEEFDTDVNFWRVKIRPGSPFAFGKVGRLGGIPWFGLPGNPVSSMVTYEIFARPALLRMSGRGRIFRAPVKARLLEDVRTQKGLTHFIRVRLEADGEGGWLAHSTGAQGSGILTSLAAADGLMAVPAGSGGADSGARLSVIPLDASSVLVSESPLA
ncbi:MAG: gephyrin-like molybdotransferase Glp [Gemmatimonadota bacterium]